MVIAVLSRLRRRVLASGAELGFTLTELLVVATIIAILAGTAVAVYSGIVERAHASSARSQVREALPAIEAYYAENGTYAGLSLATLRERYDGALSDALRISGVTEQAYCISATVGTSAAHLVGPGGSLQGGGCPEDATPTT